MKPIKPRMKMALHAKVIEDIHFYAFQFSLNKMRFSCQYKLAHPITFRRSSAKILPDKNKKNVGWGSNSQNWEESLREIFTPDGFTESIKEKCIFWLTTGDLSIFTEEELMSLRVFAQTDQSGAEAVIVAYDTEPGDYRQLFIHGVKPHVYVALKLFREVWFKKAQQHNLAIGKNDIDVLYDTPIGLLKKNPYWHDLDLLIKSSDGWDLTERYYYFAKQTVHSFSYGIEWHTFIMNVLEKSGGKIVISPDDGKRFLGEVRCFFPEVPSRCQRIDGQVRSTGILYNMFGFPFVIWPGGRPPDSLLTDMKKYHAWGPQSTVGEIIRVAYTKLHNYIVEHNKDWDILGDCHDSCLTQGRLFDVKERIAKQEEFICQQFVSPIDGAHFRMKCETNIGFCWRKYKKGICEHGLRELKWT